MNKLPEIYFSENILSPLKIDVMSFETLRRVLEQSISHDPFQPHRLKFHAILFIADGDKGTHNIDFENYAYESGSMMLISKEQIHAFKDLPNTNEGYILTFTEELFLEIGATYPLLINHLYNSQLYSPILKVEAEKFEELHALVLKIIQEVNEKQPAVWIEIAKSYLKILLLELFSWRAKQDDKIEKSPYLEEFIQFQQLLRENITKEKKVKFYAEQLHITSKKLNIITQSAVNQTAKDFILAAVILEAKKYLKCSKLTSKEVAYKLGFIEPTNFTKFFKKHTQMLPSEFAQLK